MDGSNQQSLPFTLAMAPGGGIVRATFRPGAGNTAPDLATVKAALHSQGYGEFHLDDDAIGFFIEDCARATQPVSADIAERRNASFSLEISDDLMSVWLTLAPAQGGSPIGVQVHDALRDHDITFGILHAELNAALAGGWCDRLLIAQGEPVTPGTPGRFEVLFDPAGTTVNTVDEHAKVKFRDLSHLLLVHANDPLMRIYPPNQGKPGKNIKGQVVPAEPLPEIRFGADLQGSEQDKSDPNLLVAIHAGQPVELSDGVIVNPVITVQHVDLSTGTIRFEGTVHVEGDIKTGMSVEVSGDVIVNGMIESADIQAGGNVGVKGGVIGRAEKKAGTQQLSESAARIRCGGSVQAQFIENAHIEAGASIQVEQNARNCELIARQEIIVGKSGTRGGQIVGGRAQAGMLIQADVLGAANATKTVIQVGVDPYLEEQIVNKREAVKRKIADMDQIVKLIVYFQRNPQKNVDGIAKKVEAKRIQQLAEINAERTELAALEAQLQSIEKACLKVGKTVHDGVEVQIGKQSWLVREDSGSGTYRVSDTQIILA